MTKSEKVVLKAGLPMENCVSTLQMNAESSVLYAGKGRGLLEQIGREGMNEFFAGEIRAYIAECTCEVGRMNCIRKPFTTELVKWQKQFVAFEKSIDPAEKGSPAYEASCILFAYMKKQMNEAENRALQLQKNRNRTEKRIAGRDDLSDEQKSQALQKADSRLLAGQAALQLTAVATDLIPVVTDPEGYIDLLRFWWQELGRNLSDDDLERIFRPMLSYARKQARKGVRVKSVYVEYREEPKGVRAA